MDFLSEMCAIKDKEYLTGTYYKRITVTTSDGGEKFSYEVLDPHTREYRTVMNNLVVQGNIMAIKTRSTIKFKEKGYIVTQEGNLWQITAITENVQSNRSKQALRFFTETAQTEKTIRMIGVENPRGLK